MYKADIMTTKSSVLILGKIQHRRKKEITVKILLEYRSNILFLFVGISMSAS
jgi:hypothetical protein